MQLRIGRMLRHDETMDGALVVFVWLAVEFVFFGMNAWIGGPMIHWISIAAAGVSLLFDTLFMVAMIGRYDEDKKLISERDIQHLDANRQAANANIETNKEVIK